MKGYQKILVLKDSHGARPASYFKSQMRRGLLQQTYLPSSDFPSESDYCLAIKNAKHMA